MSQLKRNISQFIIYFKNQLAIYRCNYKFSVPKIQIKYKNVPIQTYCGKKMRNKVKVFDINELIFKSVLQIPILLYTYVCNISINTMFERSRKK